MGILQKNAYKNAIEKDTESTIANVIFNFFNKKKVILSKKSIFRLIMTSNIFHLKIIFYIGKMVSKTFWRSKKVFPATWEREQIDPPLSCCWENVKKCQNFTYGYFDKNSKNTIINRETVFTKIFEKTRTYGDFDENFQKFAGRLGGSASLAEASQSVESYIHEKIWFKRNVLSHLLWQSIW